MEIKTIYLSKYDWTVTIFYDYTCKYFEDVIEELEYIECGEESLKRAYKNYLIDNTSQQYNFIDLLRTSTTIAQPVLLRKAFDFATSGTQLFFANGFNYVTGNPEDMYTKDDNLKGLNTFLKSVPYTAFGQDFYNKVKNINVNQYGWFNPSDDRYRN